MVSLNIVNIQSVHHRLNTNCQAVTPVLNCTAMMTCCSVASPMSTVHTFYST